MILIGSFFLFVTSDYHKRTRTHTHTHNVSVWLGREIVLMWHEGDFQKKSAVFSFSTSLAIVSFISCVYDCVHISDMHVMNRKHYYCCVFLLLCGSIWRFKFRHSELETIYSYYICTVRCFHGTLCHTRMMLFSIMFKYREWKATPTTFAGEIFH